MPDRTSILTGWIPKASDQKKYWTHWQRYKAFFNVSVFRYFVTFFAIVPILAKLLPKSLTLDGIRTFDLALPFKWELLWLSAFFFVVAYCIYLMACPRFIKKHGSYKDYQDQGHSPRWLVKLFKEFLLDVQESVESQKKRPPKWFRSLTTKKFIIELDKPQTCKYPSEVVEEKRTVLKFTVKEKLYVFSMPILDTTGNIDIVSTATAEKEIFWDIFASYASSKKFIRMLISVLIIISGILFSIVLAQNINEALKYIFPGFYSS